MSADEVKPLRQSEQGNARLKKALAKRDLEIDVMKAIAAKNKNGEPLATLKGCQQASLAYVRALPVITYFARAIGQRCRIVMRHDTLELRDGIGRAQYRTDYRRAKRVVAEIVPD
ncbi:hypothetical protein [Megalodesulfovibrio gigas]|uniref:hypothetical protein n=1 Tax=Megalodesulfovibrio gigas TaxID=879 RepID=UPI0038995810